MGDGYNKVDKVKGWYEITYIKNITNYSYIHIVLLYYVISYHYDNKVWHDIIFISVTNHALPTIPTILKHVNTYVGSYEEFSIMLFSFKWLNKELVKWFLFLNGLF